MFLSVRSPYALHSIVEKAIRNKGVTWSPVTKETPTEGFVVSTFPDVEVVLGSNLTTLDVYDFLVKTLPLFYHVELPDRANGRWTTEPKITVSDDRYFGAWYDESTAQWYLDVVTVVQDREDALLLAKEHDQLAVWDISAAEEIRTGVER